jgi:hypothetical protein
MDAKTSPGTLRSAVTALALIALSACSVLKPAGYADFKVAVDSGDALQIYDTLEALIANDDDTRNDRKIAFAKVRNRNEDTAAFQFAWAALAGRLVQQRGLLAANLVGDIEKHARRSVEIDPKFRNGAATRLLGTMYVVAPSSMVDYGNSELGLEMLLGLVDEYPDDPENHLRVAEAYIALNDPLPAATHLCACIGVRETMRKDDQKLLENLIADAGKVQCGDTTVTVADKKKRH